MSVLVLHLRLSASSALSIPVILLLYFSSFLPPWVSLLSLTPRHLFEIASPSTPATLFSIVWVFIPSHPVPLSYHIFSERCEFKTKNAAYCSELCEFVPHMLADHRDTLMSLVLTQKELVCTFLLSDYLSKYLICIWVIDHDPVWVFELCRLTTSHAIWRNSSFKARLTHFWNCWFLVVLRYDWPGELGDGWSTPRRG